MKASEIAIPEAWPQMIRKAMIHVASLAYTVILCSREQASNSQVKSTNLKGELEQAENEISLLREQQRIICDRFCKIPTSKRPYYAPEDRLLILTIKAVRGWNNRQAAKEFMIDEDTIANWLKHIDCEDGSIFRKHPPVNKYPETVQYATQLLKKLVPTCGKKRIAEYFVRAGLNLCATTVGRYLKKPPVKPPDPEGPDNDTGKVVPVKKIISRHPNHTWHIDLTAVSVNGGFWSSIFPFAFPQKWPFCWWVAVIIDHFSRRVIGFAVFKSNPCSEEITDALDKAIERTGKAPKYIISDKGTQFYSVNAKPENRKNHNYHQWCKRNGIKPRFGAIGKHGSVAIIERFILTMKTEYFWRLPLIPLRQDNLQKELALYIIWYNCYRPHQTLKSRTPEEVYANSTPIKQTYQVHNSQLPDLLVSISYLEGRKHLPVIEIVEKAA